MDKTIRIPAALIPNETRPFAYQDEGKRICYGERFTGSDLDGQHAEEMEAVREFELSRIGDTWGEHVSAYFQEA